MTPRKPFSKQAFSLVEITLALGIFSFVLVSMVGLMGISANAERTADFDSVVTRIAQNTAAWVKNKGFEVMQQRAQDDVVLDEEENDDQGNGSGGGSGGSPIPSTGVDFYFKADGSLIRGVNGEPYVTTPPPDEAVYSGRVTVWKTNSPDVIRLRYEFQWLMGAGSEQYTWSFVTKMSDHD